MKKTKLGYKSVKSLFGKYETIPEDWKFKKLDEIGEIIGGGTPDSDKEEFWDGDVLWAVPTDITKQSSKFIDNTERKISEQGLKDSSAKLLPKGTLLITSRATIGECSINTKPMSTNQGFQNLICNKENFNEFWYYAIKYHRKRLMRLSHGTTFLEISKSGISQVSIPTPKLKIEQQKIASTLSNVDNLIGSYEKVIELMKMIKKGVLKKLITEGINHKKSQVVNVVPRFKTFSVPDEWNVQFLIDISNEIKDGPMGFVLHTSDYVEHGIPMLRIQNLKGFTISRDDLKFISKQKHWELQKSQVKPNDIIISKTGIIGAVGKVPLDYGEANLSTSLARIQLKNHKNADFVTLFLMSEIIQSIIKILGSSRTVQPGLKLSDIKNLKIPIPPPDEQKKISDILYYFDKILFDLELKKRYFEIIKKGLMQKLLMGEIRINL